MSRVMVRITARQSRFICLAILLILFAELGGRGFPRLIDSAEFRQLPQSEMFPN
jgi:hypothetical protein